MFEILKPVRLTALVALTTIAGPTFAAEKPVVIQGDISNLRSERVSYASLDLTQARDQKTLSFRVAGAVDRVCLRENYRKGLQESSFYDCERSSWENAQPQIDRAIARASQFAQNGRQQVAAMTITVSAS